MQSIGDSISRSLYFQKAMAPVLFDSIEIAKSRLRNMTWRDVINTAISINYPEFYPRIGAFLGKPAIAVFWKGEILTLRYIKHQKMNGYRYIYEQPIMDGYALMRSDFENKIDNIKITDKVLTMTNKLDANGWAIPRDGTRTRAIYELYIAKIPKKQIHNLVGGTYNNMLVLIHRFQHHEKHRAWERARHHRKAKS